MQALNTAIIATDEEQRLILTLQVNGTGLATVVNVCDSIPISTKDAALRRLCEACPQVVLFDIASDSAKVAPQAIELITSTLPDAIVFAIGDLSQPACIIETMRAGAKEYLGRPTTAAVLSDALLRVSSMQKRSAANTGERGKVFTFLNAKGGCGSTTTAVNTAIALQKKGSVLLVDLAILGHVALQMNLKPSFTVREALTNLHRLDDSLLQSIVTKHSSGVQVLAGSLIAASDVTGTSMAALFDLLVHSYQYVIVDVSTRLDNVAQFAMDNSDEVLLVASMDVPSLWSAARICEHATSSRKRTKLVLNRFRKVAGFSDSDIERSTGIPIYAKIPNQYSLVSGAIDRGVPVCEQNHSEISNSFISLADQLTGAGSNRKFAVGSLLFSRAG
jgi:pilus assembly protein CpaE